MLAFEKALLTVDGSEANGRLVLNLGGERPLIDATLDFSQLDLTPHVEAARLQLFGFDLPGTAWPSFDISLPMIRYLDADLRISARKVVLKGHALGRGAATITAHAGKLQADITELELGSGTLSAQITAIMSEIVPRYVLRAKIENIETGPASTLILGATALAGRATVTADLTSTGYSLHEIIRRLSGKATLTMPEGRPRRPRRDGAARSREGRDARLGQAGEVAGERRAARGTGAHHRRRRLRHGDRGPLQRLDAGRIGPPRSRRRQHGRASDVEVEPCRGSSFQTRRRRRDPEPARSLVRSDRARRIAYPRPPPRRLYVTNAQPDLWCPGRE